MKIRSDFVTNSSSSSYCVSLSVKSKSGQNMELDYWPTDEDGSGCVHVPLKEKTVDTVMEEIKGCQSVAELKDLLLNALDLHCLFDEVEEGMDVDEDVSNDTYLTMIAQAVEENEDFEIYVDAVAEVQEQNAAFCQAMEQLNTLEELESVTIREYFTGWGEFARDSVDDFLEAAAPDGNCGVLEEKLTEDELALISEHLENDSICQVEASITTTLHLANGTIETAYSFEGDCC